jgi:hypothetical protein
MRNPPRLTCRLKLPNQTPDAGSPAIVHFGWLWRREFAGMYFDKAPNLARWYGKISAHSAVHWAIERVNALIQPT